MDSSTLKRLLAVSLLLSWFATPLGAADNPIFARSNLTSWCIVPFDAKKRGPEERARMLARLGIKKFAYDWRTEHVPLFDNEVAAMKRHGIEITAWWFPGALNTEARAILECIQRHNLRPQLWVMMEGGPHLRFDQAFESTPGAQLAHVERMVSGLKPIAAEAAKLGCQVALYNHGGWFGIPENQIQIIQRLEQAGIKNVGMVYTQHHGHGEIDRFAELFRRMKPHLLALTLNGMIKDGDLTGLHDLGTAPLGQGDQDLRLLRIIHDSGWSGPIGIVGETESVDVELRLRDHLEGLDWLLPQLEGQPPGPLLVPRSWKRPATPTPGHQGSKAVKKRRLTDAPQSPHHEPHDASHSLLQPGTHHRLRLAPCRRATAARSGGHCGGADALFGKRPAEAGHPSRRRRRGHLPRGQASQDRQHGEQF